MNPTVVLRRESRASSIPLDSEPESTGVFCRPDYIETIGHSLL